GVDSDGAGDGERAAGGQRGAEAVDDQAVAGEAGAAGDIDQPQVQRRVGVAGAAGGDGTGKAGLGDGAGEARIEAGGAAELAAAVGNEAVGERQRRRSGDG